MCCGAPCGDSASNASPRRADYRAAARDLVARETGRRSFTTLIRDIGSSVICDQPDQALALALRERQFGQVKSPSTTVAIVVRTCLPFRRGP